MDTKDLAGHVKAITFDTGGTVLDWFGTINAAFAEVGAARAADEDWAALTRTWRRHSTGMVKAFSRTDNGAGSTDMDGVLSETLTKTLAEHGVSWPTDENKAALVAAWRTMRPWPDIPSALPRLRRRYLTAPFTIMKTALVLSASRHADLQWDAIFSCEMIGAYKTHPDAYATVVRWLDVQPSEILMVTAHNDDLLASHGAGFHTAFVRRPDEWGGESSPNGVPDDCADIVVDDLHALADALEL